MRHMINLRIPPTPTPPLITGGQGETGIVGTTVFSSAD